MIVLSGFSHVWSSVYIYAALADPFVLQPLVKASASAVFVGLVFLLYVRVLPLVEFHRPWL